MLSFMSSITVDTLFCSATSIVCKAPVATLGSTVPESHLLQIPVAAPTTAPGSRPYRAPTSSGGTGCTAGAGLVLPMPLGKGMNMPAMVRIGDMAYEGIGFSRIPFEGSD